MCTGKSYVNYTQPAIELMVTGLWVIAGRNTKSARGNQKLNEQKLNEDGNVWEEYNSSVNGSVQV